MGHRSASIATLRRAEKVETWDGLPAHMMRSGFTIERKAMENEPPSEKQHTEDEQEYLESLTDGSSENVDELIESEHEKQIAAQQAEIDKLTRRNALLEREYKRLHAQLNTGIAVKSDIIHTRSVPDAETLIKDSMRGHYYGGQ